MRRRLFSGGAFDYFTLDAHNLYYTNLLSKNRTLSYKNNISNVSTIKKQVKHITIKQEQSNTQQ